MSDNYPLKRFVVFGRGKDHSPFGAENYLRDFDSVEAAATYARTWTQGGGRESHVWDTHEVRLMEELSV